MNRLALPTAACLLALSSVTLTIGSAPEPPDRDGVALAPTLEQRVAAQREIERVYHDRRIWPADNPGPRPTFEASIPEALLRARVEDALRKSAALDAVWGRPVTADLLQSEMDRMSRSTQAPDTLRAIFDALGRDPRLFAETFARQVLADRLIRKAYAGDPQSEQGFDAWWNARRGDFLLETASDAAASYVWHEPTGGAGCTGDWSKLTGSLPPGSEGVGVWTGAEMLVWHENTGGARYSPAANAWTPMETTGQPTRGRSAVWTGSEMLVWGGYGTSPAPGGRYDPLSDLWLPMSTAGAPAPREFYTAIWTGTEMIVWGGFPGFNSGGRYDPDTDTWTPTPLGGAPSARHYHSAVWTGSEMIVWSGRYYDFGLLEYVYRDDGARYVPDVGWLPMSNLDAPGARIRHTAVWTGSEMIVWGGSDLDGTLGDGGRYDPDGDTWTAVSAVNAPSPRAGHTAVWTDEEMIVWGGAAAGSTSTGGRYDPDGDSWQPTSTIGAPSARTDHVGVWDGAEMIVWGGGSITGGRYDPATDGWTPTTDGYRPDGRTDHTAVWTGAEMIVWGGAGNEQGGVEPERNTGARYDPATAAWTATSTTGAPSARRGHSAVWTGQEMVVWGGESVSGADQQFDTGARYDPGSDSWQPTTTTAAPSARAGHTAVWTGTEMVVWGGRWPTPTATGARYEPATDQWTPMTVTGAPSPRESHTAIWTGEEMIVWGSSGTGGHNLDGGRYTPGDDAWAPLPVWPLANAATYEHSAVWTGSEMIVWGGYDPPDEVSTGARYSPATNAWTPLATASAPAARQEHAAVWDGAEMIVWGGRDGGALLGSGGRYDPVLDAWDAWGPVSASGAPTPRYAASTVWTGTEMIVWSGYVTFGDVKSDDGGRYCADLTPDSDADGVASVLDCAPADGGTWSAPGPARDLTVDGATVAWTPPIDAGGDAPPRYDLLRSGRAHDFFAAVCAATDVSGTSVSETSSPPAGSGYYYLVRVENACGGTLGSESEGAARTGADCE